MLLTQAQIDYQAHRANWYVQVDYRDTNVPGDVSIVTGDGVDDLDRLVQVQTIISPCWHADSTSPWLR